MHLFYRNYLLIDKPGSHGQVDKCENPATMNEEEEIEQGLGYDFWNHPLKR